MAGCSRALSEGHGTEPMKLSMSEVGTSQTCRRTLKMSAYGRRSEVIGERSKRCFLSRSGPQHVVGLNANACLVPTFRSFRSRGIGLCRAFQQCSKPYEERDHVQRFSVQCFRSVLCG
jgi:hypothetical protein